MPAQSDQPRALKRKHIAKEFINHLNRLIDGSRWPGTEMSQLRGNMA